MKTSVVRGLAAILFVLTAPVIAQSLRVSPDPLSAGGTANLTYDDATKPGKIIVVTVGGGMPWTVQVVEITLDAAGHGTGTWAVPAAGWNKGYFNAPNVAEQIILIQ